MKCNTLNDYFVSIGESIAEAFVDVEAFVFECRVPKNISYKIPKVESSYVLKGAESNECKQSYWNRWNHITFL